MSSGIGRFLTGAAISALRGVEWATFVRELLRLVDRGALTEREAIATLRRALEDVDAGRLLPFFRGRPPVAPAPSTPPAPALPEWTRGGRGRSRGGRR